MKKLLFGCLVVLVVGAIGLSVAGYFAYRAARPALESAGEYVRGLTRLTALSEIDADIANVEPYDPPANGELTPEQVERFARVQTHVRDTLGARVGEIEAKYRGLDVDQAAAASASFGDALRALSELGQVVVDARRAQVDGLNREGFSQAEYTWVRTSVFQAAGYELAGGLDLGQVGDLVREGAGQAGFSMPEGRMPSVSLPDVPDRNRELVGPLADRLQDWLPLAFFGI